VFPNLFFDGEIPEINLFLNRGNPSVGKAHRPDEIDSKGHNSITANLLSRKYSCENILCIYIKGRSAYIGRGIFGIFRGISEILLIHSTIFVGRHFSNALNFTDGSFGRRSWLWLLITVKSILPCRPRCTIRTFISSYAADIDAPRRLKCISCFMNLQPFRQWQ